VGIVSGVWEGWVESGQAGGMAEFGGEGRIGTFLDSITPRVREKGAGAADSDLGAARFYGRILEWR
jgi:hypothetical protein